MARFAGSGDYTVRGPRRWAMKMLAVILSRITRARLTDSTSGFRACGPRAIALSEPFMREVVANLDNDWTLTSDEVQRAIDRIETRK